MLWPGGRTTSFAPLRFLRWLSSISDCWIEWFTPFVGIRYSTNGHRTVFHRTLSRQCRVDACVLARWTHSAFRAYGVPTQAFFHQRLLDRMPYALRWYPAFNQWLPCSVSLHSALAVSCRRLYSSTGRRTAPFAPMAFPTLAFFHQRLLDRMPYALRKYP